MTCIAYTIDNVATRERKNPKPEYGKRLEARRKVLRKSLDDIVAESNGEIYKQLWYRVENGIKMPKSLTIEQLKLFARALEWSPEQLADALMIPPSDREKLSDILGSDRIKAWAERENDPLERFAPPEIDWTHFHVMHSASAGTGEPELLDDDEIVSIPTQKLRARGATQKDVMVVKVNGDCLVSQNLRTSRRSIAHGDYVFIHMGAAAQSSDIICVWDEQDSQLMLKFLSEQQDPENPNEITFYDSKGRTYIRNIADVKYRGVVFYRAGEL